MVVTTFVSPMVCGSISKKMSRLAMTVNSAEVRVVATRRERTLNAFLEMRQREASGRGLDCNSKMWAAYLPTKSMLPRGPDFSSDVAWSFQNTGYHPLAEG